MFKTKSIMSLIKKFGGVHMRWTMGLNKENASEGSANGDVELFAGREVSSTIRETIQNSSDVPADDKIPVKIEIKMYKVVKRVALVLLMQIGLIRLLQMKLLRIFTTL